jgi:hypothetical protein|tara:strand:- start:728 stop:1600 length:873 start_codon:yes stop_codon:yes gene_type:complete
MGKLNEKAMLIKVELKKWGGTKTDKSLAEEISDNHSTDSSLYSVSKKLTKNATLKAIKKIDGQIRTDCIYSGAGYRGFCLAWDNSGNYLLPIDAKDRFEKRFAEYRDDREKLVKKFLSEYPNIINDARTEFGSTFKESDFPNPAEIEDCFSCEIIKNPVPSTDDIRVNLSKDEIDELKANGKAQEDAKIKEITDSVIDKVNGVLGHFSEKIKAGETFRDSTLDKVIDLCDVLPALNIDGDAKIHQAHQSLMDVFHNTDIDAKTLRDDKDKAKEVVDASDKILEELSGWVD